MRAYYRDEEIDPIKSITLDYMPMHFKLLSRDEFRNAVFLRSKHKCCICGEPAQDAHHILERRLWSNGGYYLENGASLCGICHINAETTHLTCEEIREACGIEKFPIPDHLYRDVRYDKWGNVYMADGRRAPGDLFNDESVQKILDKGGMLSEFSWHCKYPRTYHLPWSGCVGKDDRTLSKLPFFDGEIVVTLKMDGENTTMYSDKMHARSIDGVPHHTQSWVRNLHGQIAHDIPEGWRICGENLYAKHSIAYENLASYFYVFSIWNEKNECLSWDETIEWARLLSLETVPVIYRGIWKEWPIRFHTDIWQGRYPEDKNEGYVIRNADKFHYSQFRTNVGKYVRKDHVTSSTHWKFEKIETNKLAS